MPKFFILLRFFYYNMQKKTISVLENIFFVFLKTAVGAFCDACTVTGYLYFNCLQA